MTKLFTPLLAGALVVVTLGVYANMHTPQGIAVNVAGFSSPQSVKTWLATVAMLLALVQLASAYAIYGPAAPWVSTVHRWSGRIAFLLMVPVAVHCLYALGFSTSDTRTLLHSALGCLFFGVFTVKMLILPKRGLAGWVLPLVGGLVFTVLVGLWLTSSLWFFTTFGVTV